jgi:hypothetical protein
MGSQQLYRLLHQGEKWVKDRLLIQDFTLPESKLMEFMADVEKQTSIYPLWICPIRRAEASQLFAPNVSHNDPLTINVGVYGLPKTLRPAAEVLATLERRAAQLGGRKWLYTHSCYSLDAFWQIYPEADYRMLRQKYNADGVFMSIENKVLSN